MNIVEQMRRAAFGRAEAAIAPPVLDAPRRHDDIPGQAEHTFAEGRLRATTPQTLDAVIQVRLQLDERGESVPFAQRSDGSPGGQEHQRFAIALGPMFDSQRTAEAAAQRGYDCVAGATCVFVAVQLGQAHVVDCLDVDAIDEESIRHNNRAAIRLLRAFREAGADALWVNGMRGDRVAVIFTAALGHRIRVEDEAPYRLESDGSWTRQVVRLEAVPDAPPATADGRPPSPAPILVAQPGHGLRGIPTLALFALELMIAIAGAMLAPEVARMLGTTVVMPIWLAALIAVGTVVATVAALRCRRCWIRRG